MEHYGIYIHIPFCVKKCNYCDFLSFNVNESTIEKYICALIQEIRAEQFLTKDTIIDTIYFGGGTPSYIASRYIEEILCTLRNKFVISKDAEITIEVNPGTIDIEKLNSYKNAGINRISMGVQSFRNDELKLLGRIHDKAIAINGYDMLRSVGFNNISLDIISHLPGQNEKEVGESLDYIGSLKPEHVSVYNLIIEPGTPFYDKYSNQGAILLPDESMSERIDQCISEKLSLFGYNKYEISNYSIQGCESRHNTSYWNRKPYRGYGLGAASLLRNKCDYRFTAENNMSDYLTASNLPLDQRKNGQEPLRKLSQKEKMEEYMFLGLRQVKGINTNSFKEFFSVDIEDIYGDVIKKYQKLNLLECDNELIWLNNNGLVLSNIILSEFLID